MSDLIELSTARLLLRQWRPADRESFSALNADPHVMAYFPNTLSRQESDELAMRIEMRIREKGWGFWAVEIPHQADFIGFVGLNIPAYALPFGPCVEVGWRLARGYWGQGYASEAANAALAAGFQRLQLSEIVSFTALENLRSRAVMERLGMTHIGEQFDHPALPDGHALRRHVLYRLSRDDWMRQTLQAAK